MALKAQFSHRRSRNLAVLAGVTVLSVALALAALFYRETMVAPKNTPMPLFPGLAQKLANGEATHIYIVSKKYGAVEIAFIPSKGWVLPERGNYPASFETVQQTLVAIAAMETSEPKTDRPDWFHYVDLDPPPQGGGTIVTLSADKGYVLASMILGKAEMVGDELGLFVRRAGENQSWLVKSPAEIKTNPSDWMDKNVINLDRGRIASVEVRPATGPAYTATRAIPDASFTIAPLPKGRELAYPDAADATAAALAGFAFDDIKPATDLDFASGARLTLHTFDGLTVISEAIQQGGDTWVRLYASAAPGSQKAAKDALAINARTSGWAFKLPAFKASAFAPALESLLKPKK